MSLRHLETLVAIAETGSFHAAADRLGITQSAVSMQMKTLEDDLSVALFDRSRRPPVLNALGRGLLTRAREVLAGYAALRQAALSGDLVTGQLRLGVIPTVGSARLPAALKGLSKRHPALRLRIESDLSEPLIARLLQGELDAALVTAPARIPARLVSTVVEEEDLVVIGAGTLDREPLATLLSEQPFIRFNRRSGIGQVIDRALKEASIHPREAMELDSVEAIIAMASHGLGLAIVPEGSLPIEGRKLSRRPFGAPAVTRSVILLEPTDRPLAKLTNQLVAALQR